MWILILLAFLLGAVVALIAANRYPVLLTEAAKLKATVDSIVNKARDKVDDFDLAKFRAANGNPADILKAMTAKSGPSVGGTTYPDWFWRWLNEAYCLAMVKRCKAAIAYWQKKGNVAAVVDWTAERDKWQALADSL